MEYTISQLAKMAKVSVRTLHHYDAIDLLKPAYHGGNGYRFYGEEELLLLQQILFFRELGMELKKIKELVTASQFNKIAALNAHRKVIDKERKRMGELMKTIDRTVKYLTGEIKMKDREFYRGFNSEKQESYEKYLVDQHGQEAQDLIEESKRRTKNWSQKDWEEYKSELDALNRALVSALKKNLSPGVSEVQALIARHFKMVTKFYTPSKEVYLGLGKLYMEHEDFRGYYASYHERLARYLAEAMVIYAENHL